MKQKVINKLPISQKNYYMCNLRQLSESAEALLQAVFDYLNQNGSWPQSHKLNIELRRFGDLWENAKAIGFEYIEAGQPHDDSSTTKLTALGLSVCEGSDEILKLFVEAVRLCADKYIENPGKAIITGNEIFTGLKLQHKDLSALINVFKGEYRFATGHNMDSDPYSFELRLNKDILKFENINKIEDYLRIAYFAKFASIKPAEQEKYDPWEYIPFYSNSGFAAGINNGPSLSLSELLKLLHPAICENCCTLFESSHYSAAVEKAIKVVRARLLELTGNEKPWEDFGKGKKIHITGATAPNVDGDFNEAVKFLLISIGYFRNEAFHSLDSRINHPGRAYEYLTICSLAMSLLDDAEIL